MSHEKVKGLGPALVGPSPECNGSARVVDMYASAALQGLLARSEKIDPVELARISFSIAMEMLVERQNMVEKVFVKEPALP